MLGTLKLLEKSALVTLDQVASELNYGRQALEKALKLLEVDGAVQHEKAGYSRTANRWQPDSARFEQVTQHRLIELAEIKRYVGHEGCLMEFLARALDDPAAAPCGKCMNCAGKKTRRVAPATLIQEAVGFLRSDALVLEPRDRWPAPVLQQLHKHLPEALDRFESGRPKTVILAGSVPQQGVCSPCTVMRAGENR